jgi:cell division protease FtsH
MLRKLSPWRAGLAGVVVVLLLGSIGIAWWRRQPTAVVAAVPISEVLQQAARGEVVSVVLRGGDELQAELRDGRRVRATTPPGYVAANPTFVADLAARGIRVEVESAGGTPGPLPIALGILVLGVALMGGGAVMTGRLPLRGVARTVPAREDAGTCFNDVAGVDEARDEVREIATCLREPDRFRAAGGRIPRGVLLVGPPGTGKTLLARAIAAEAGVPFLFASGSDFVEKYVGVGASRVRRLFREARRHRACIVFIDEIDAVGRHRGAGVAVHEEREQTLNQLLVEMDGFDGSSQVIVLAATNRADVLDQALLRPGRFDRQVHVGLPDLKGREDILRVHARRLTLGTGVDLRAVARGTPGFSGADLANVVNEAALQAARQGRVAVAGADFEHARDKVLMGVERTSLVMTEAERITCAYHEAGHAVVAAVVPGADPLHKVTIIPRGQALGVTMQLPEEDRHTYSKRFLEAQLAILMGGRVAEEVFLQQMTSGAANDIERATDIARRMVCTFGMSGLGMRAFVGDGKGPFSERAGERVDTEIDRILADAYRAARAVIAEHHDGVEALAQALLAVETLDAAEIAAVLDERQRARVPRAC